ncbi:MAG: hypothetical protein QM764_11615 [Chitinophagaceae bacterium]
MNGSYPIHLRQRISNGNGHLSNMQALELFRTHRPSFMTHLFLSHLSHNNNSPELVKELFKRYTDKTTISIASREKEGAVYFINSIQSNLLQEKNKNKDKPLQLSLF